jgi:hypothetical protein
MAALALACLGLFAACGSTPAAAGPPQPLHGGPIRELHVMSAPVGMNFDNQPGPDGFSVRVFATDASHPKPIRIDRGQLEILMFDGTFYGRTNVPPALRIWTFTAAELRPNEFTARIGTGYNFNLLWGTNRPTQRMISVAARYTSPEHDIVTSRPSSVAVVSR